MKKLFSVLTALLLVVGMMPLVFADGADIGSGIIVDVPGDTDVCHPPQIFVDPSAKIWNPNDQTYYTAELYGEIIPNAYGMEGYVVDQRQNYMFTGETMAYVIAVYDEDGENDIVGANVLVNGVGVGACSFLPDSAITGVYGDAAINAHFSIPPAVAYDRSGADATAGLYKFFRCTLIAQSAWTDVSEVTLSASDGGKLVCVSTPTTVASEWTDYLDMNPTLALDLVGGPIDFGTVAPGETSTSNTVYLVNDAEAGSAVVMDMYIASDDYFTDPSNPSAICGAGNGIPYTAFSYYATKGTINSGENDNTNPGLSVAGDVCIAGTDEYTGLPSHSGEIGDMCRIINLEEDASLLNQGAEMSMTFKLDVPRPCEGNFVDGSFQFVGRVV